SFVAAGDALAALDAAAPSLGLEISTDGLRRLARVLDPSYAGDPLAYTEAPDPVLRELFHFHEPPPSESSPAPPPAGASGWLVPAVAWQESCWRQFVERDGKVTYLLSKSGDVGIMQVNRRVWRGFFDLAKLESDIAYNAGAGAEILAQFLTRYGAREASGRLE